MTESWHKLFSSITNNARFVPLARAVTPAPAQLHVAEGDTAAPLSHDVPIEGALSGVIEMTWQARTPVLFGTQRVVRSGDRVCRLTEPQRLHSGADAPYVIPGRALRGMIRQVLRIATHAKLGPIDPVRPVRRDPDYQKQRLGGAEMRPPSAGWLVVTQEGRWELHPVTPQPIAHGDPRIRALDLGGRFPKTLKEAHRRLAQTPAFLQNIGNAHLILSGKMPRKRAEQLFPKPGNDQAIPLTAEDMEALLRAYGKLDARGLIVPDSNLAIWANEYLAILDGQKAQTLRETFHLPANHTCSRVRPDRVPGIPVYFYRVEGRLVLGMTQIMRFPAEYSVGEVAERSQTSFEGKRDWSEAILGYAEEDEGLRGRVAFGFARTDSTKLFPASPDQYLKLIQLAPKPGFGPFYLRHGGAVNGPVHYDADTTLLAGRKRYGVWTTQQIKDAKQTFEDLPNAEPSTDDPLSVESYLKFVDSGAEFGGTIRFHNMLPMELGALLWALSLGDAHAFHGSEHRPTHCHVGGRARGHCFGNLAPLNIRLVGLRETCRIGVMDRAVAEPDWRAYVLAFGKIVHKAETLEALNSQRHLARLRHLSNLARVDQRLWFGTEVAEPEPFDDYKRLRRYSLRVQGDPDFTGNILDYGCDPPSR